MVATSETVQQVDSESDELTGESSGNASEIPVRNWWHMLVYAWGLVDLEGIFQSKWEDAPDLHELLIRILVDRTNRQVRRGLRGDYVDRSEALKTVRGRIDFNRTLGDLLLYKGQLHCEYQEYSVNVPRNQIIATTLQRQYRREFKGAKGRDIEELKSDVGRLVRTLDEIDRIRLDRSLMTNEIRQLGRNEREYKLLLKVCEMLYRPTMPLASEEYDAEAFTDWLENRKHRIYEEFVANFYSIKLSRNEWVVSPQTTLRWNEKEQLNEGVTRLPTMRPDIVVTHKDSGKIVVIDTKWYSSVFTDRFDQLTVHSSNLYQMYAYMASQDWQGGRYRDSAGILLYAQTEKDDVDFRTEIDGHPFRVYTLDLTQDWEGVEGDLVELLNCD